jgi:hypothetical protein
MNTFTKVKKATIGFIFLCSFASYIYLQIYNSNHGENDFTTKIEGKTEKIFEKNKNNFDQNSVIKIVTKNIINVIIISRNK